MDHAPNSFRTMHRAPGCIQPRHARHRDSHDETHESIDQAIGFHGVLTCLIDGEDFESHTKQIKALAFKRCPVPFSILDNRSGEE
jgi:hypothetical protein